MEKYYGDDKVIAELNVRDVEQFRDHLRITAPLGHKIYITTLKAAFNKAVDWDMISFNPFIKIKLVKGQQKLPRFMKLDELMLLRKHTNSPIIANIFLFAFYTGCRPGEIVIIR